ncbi:MAG: cytochrome c oxidase subunit II transmembrane domain-containing protein, partial [Terriglobales bacterium]
MWQTLPLWPARASTLADRTDALMIFMLVVTGFFTVMIFTLIFVFAVKFRRARNPVATQIEGSNTLEATWTLIPFGIFLIMFVWGASIYMTWAQPPPDA